MELKVIGDSGQASQTVQVSDVVFGREYNEPLIHQLVVAYQANARQGTRAQKDRAEVKASTRKPWKQKGTGRARVGACPARCGAEAARFSRTAPTKTSPRK